MAEAKITPEAPKAAPAAAPKAEKAAAPKAEKAAAPKAEKAAAPKKAAAPRKAPAVKKVVAAPGAEERYRMIEVAAYYVAERHGFAGDPQSFWAEAEAQIERMLSK